jgi:hypothetical protein
MGDGGQGSHRRERGLTRHLSARRDVGLAVVLPGVVVPLAGLETPFEIDQLPLRQKLAADLRQAVPCHAGMVFGPLTNESTFYSAASANLRRVRKWNSSSGTIQATAPT